MRGEEGGARRLLGQRVGGGVHEADEFILLHREMMLGRCDPLGPVALFDRDRSFCVPQRPGVEAHPLRDTAAAGAAMAQMQQDRVALLPRQDPYGPFHAAVADAQPHHILILQSPFARQGGADMNGVAPGDLGHRLGQFLQPGIGRVSPVPDAGVRTDDDGKAVRVRSGEGRLGPFAAVRWDRDRRRARRRISDPPIDQCGAPACVIQVPGRPDDGAPH